MNKFTILTLAASLGISMATAASASDVTGAWKYTLGSKPTCSVTLSAPNAAAAATDCYDATQISHWQTTATGLELLSGNGTLVATLKAKGDGYEGLHIADGRKLVLSRDQVGAAQ